MRDELAKLDGECAWFSGTVARFGTGTPYGFDYIRKFRTVMLNDVASGGKFLSDHIWVHCQDNWPELSVGCRVRFKATVRPYRKHGGVKDYCFGRIEKMQVIGRRRV
jgi:hypothetical protein